MNKAMKMMLVLAIACFAMAAFAQVSPGNNQVPTTGTSQVGNYGSAQSPSTGSPNNGTTQFGVLPNGATGMDSTNGYSVVPGQQFNSKWNMVGGNHDLTTNTTSTTRTVVWSNSGTATTVKASAICSFCHTAHDNEGTTDRTFLWAHDVPTAFTSYSSPTLQSTPSTVVGTTMSQTAQCLGCHDGTIAVTSGNYGTPNPANNNELTINSTQITSGGKLTLTTGLVVPLSRTHPVSFTYDATLAAKHQLRVPAGNNSVDGYGIIPLFGAGGNQMECATCHDPHLNSGIMRRQFPTGATQDKGTGSFCLYCHL